MSHENPTLKMRVAIDEPLLGKECKQMALDLVGGMYGIELLDAKWGRPQSKWESDGGGWGRGKLTPYQQGYVAASKDSVKPESQEAYLISIIEGLVA